TERPLYSPARSVIIASGLGGRQDLRADHLGAMAVYKLFGHRLSLVIIRIEPVRKAPLHFRDDALATVSIDLVYVFGIAVARDDLRHQAKARRLPVLGFVDEAGIRDTLMAGEHKSRIDVGKFVQNAVPVRERTIGKIMMLLV